MHPTQHRKSHCHVQHSARASFSLSITLQEHRACVRLQNLPANHVRPRHITTSSPTNNEPTTSDTATPTPSCTAARRAALSAQCKAVARAALKPTSLRCCPSQSEKKALSAWSHKPVELSASDRHRAHLTPRQVYHEI